MSEPGVLDSTILSHLSTSLLALEIDIAQLETRVFLLFSDLRELHEKSINRTPISLSPTVSKTHAPACLLPPAVVQSNALKILDEILEAEKLEEGISEMVFSVKLQLDECNPEVGEEVAELEKQLEEIIIGLDQSRANRKNLEQWADDLYFSCHFSEMVGGSGQGSTLAQSLLARGDSLHINVERPQPLLNGLPESSQNSESQSFPSTFYNEEEEEEKEEHKLNEAVEEVRERIERLRKRPIQPPPLRLRSFSISSGVSRSSSMSSGSSIDTREPATPATPATPHALITPRGSIANLSDTPVRFQLPPLPSTPGTMGWDIAELPGTELTWEDVKNRRRQSFMLRHMHGASAVIEQDETTQPGTSRLEPSVNTQPMPSDHSAELIPVYSYEPEWLQSPPRGHMYSPKARKSWLKFLPKNGEEPKDVEGFQQPNATQKGLLYKRRPRIQQNTLFVDVQETGTEAHGGNSAQVDEEEVEIGCGKRFLMGKFYIKRASNIFSPRPKVLIE